MNKKLQTRISRDKCQDLFQVLQVTTGTLPGDSGVISYKQLYIYQQSSGSPSYHKLALHLQVKQNGHPSKKSVVFFQYDATKSVMVAQRQYRTRIGKDAPSENSIAEWYQSISFQYHSIIDFLEGVSFPNLV
jgi:hypothetical protein